MSKYTRLNKINHYHDNSSTKNPTLQREDSRMRPPLLRTVVGGESMQVDAIMTPGKRMLAPRDQGANVAGGRLPIRRQSDGRLRKPLVQLPKSTDHRHRRPSNNNNLKKPAFIALISFALVLIFGFFLDGAHSLNCYHCSSVDNPDCDEAFTGRANFTETDCEKHIGRPAKVCRKIVQYIEYKKVVIRSCGYIDEHEEKDRKPICYKRSGTFAIMMESCNCYTDNCNHSASLVPTRSVLLLASCSLAIFYYYETMHQHLRQLVTTSGR